MASLTQERPGHWRIKYTDGDQSKGIRLGRCDKKAAQTALVFIERLIAAKRLASSPDAETIAWLARLSETIHARLAKIGLTSPRIGVRSPLLGQLSERFMAALSGKPTTVALYRHTLRNLMDFLGDCRLDEVTPARADEFRNWLERQEHLSISTLGRRIVAARTIWNKAIRWGISASNPFTDVKGGHQINEARRRFVPAQDVLRIMDACGDPQWCVILAMARFAGVRVPSEILPLCWSDIDWENRKIRITSPKTEHHLGGGARLIPLYPELQKPLQDCLTQRQEGQEYIITRYRTSNTNLRTQLARFARRAGLQLWPKAFQNMRASRESELMRDYDLATACKWIGNTPAVAAKHYALPTRLDEDYRRAAGDIEGSPKGGPFPAQKAAMTVADASGQILTKSSQPIENKELWQQPSDPVSDGQENLLRPAGLEPATSWFEATRSIQLRYGRDD